MPKVLVDAEFAEVLAEWFSLLEQEGISIVPTSGYRTREEQNRLFKRLGRLGLAAAPGRSYHEYGLALDFVTVPRTPELMRRAGELAESVGLRWGGRFRIRDEVHVDAGNFISIEEARAEGYPGELVEVE